MTSSPEWLSILELYQHIVCRGVAEHLQHQQQPRAKHGVYTAEVVMWLMMLQTLQRSATLSTAVQQLREGAAGALLWPCRRVRTGRISLRTGGYCQARSKLSKLLCRQVNQEIQERLRQMLYPQQQTP